MPGGVLPGAGGRGSARPGGGFPGKKGGGGGGDRRGVGRDKEEGGGSPQSNPTTTQHLQPRLEELLPVYHSTKAVLDASRERQPQDHQDRG